MGEKDPYDILGVARSASQDEIKRAYRNLAKQYHPDRNRDNPDATKRFKEVQAAYDVIGDPERRKQFDQFGAGGPVPEYQQWQSGPGRGGGGVDFGGADIPFDNLGDLSSIFEQFFQRGGGGASTRSRRRSRPAGRGGRGQNSNGTLEHTVDLSFEEAARGTMREVSISSNGQVERINVRIPAGIEHGKKVRVGGKGHFTTSGRGDLVITCRVQPHPYFQRNGTDLVVEVPIGVTEALLGAKVEVPTLSGGRVVLTVPPGTASGTKLRIRGQGLPDLKSKQTGDLLASIRIVTPKDISDEARDLATKLQAALSHSPRADVPWS